MASVSIGNDFKDGFKETNNWVYNNLAFLSDVEQFYRQRSALEKEYAMKLNTLTSEFLKKKANKTTSVSVGDQPKITPGSLEAASMVTWNEILTQTENMAKSHDSFANELNLKVCDQVIVLQNYLSNLKNKLENYHNNSLMKSRDEFFDAVSKAKKQYDETCQVMESTRAKAERSSRHEKKLKEKEFEMNVAKNNYLLKINIANRIKDKFYYQDLPEILDLYQDINEFKTKRLNALLINSAQIEINKNNRDIKYLQSTQEVIKSNVHTLDTQMFIKHNAISWKEPQDFYYIPSSIWHDDDAFITSSDELLELKKVLKMAVEQEEKYSNKVESEKESLSSLQKSKQQLKSVNDQEFELQKALESLNSYLLTLSVFNSDENFKVRSQVEIETIENNSNGKDLNLDGLTITTKKTGFFGKLRGNTIKNKQTVVADTSSQSNYDNDDNHSIVSSQTQHTTHSGHHGFKISSLLRSKSVKSQADTTNSGTGSVQYFSALQGTALYAYNAQGSDEVSITPQEQFDIDQADDGSGWTSIVKKSGETGLVPTSYITVETIERKKPNATPPVAPTPRKSGKKIQYALVKYDYNAEDEGELTIREGDKVTILEDDGSGWTKGQKDGQIGLFPSSYVEVL